MSRWIRQSGTTRYFHGLCTEMRFRGWRGDYMYYQLVLRPWSWLLTRETRCQIFHDKSVKDIISGIFSDRGFSDVEMKLQKSYDPIPYCVQYQETTFAFISRLMERYGLFFFFEFTADKHKMMIVDDQNSLPDIPGYGGLQFRPYSETGVRGERLFDWQSESRLRTAVVDVDDYNPEKPNTALEKTGKAKDNPEARLQPAEEISSGPTGHADPGTRPDARRCAGRRRAGRRRAQVRLRLCAADLAPAASSSWPTTRSRQRERPTFRRLGAALAVRPALSRRQRVQGRAVRHQRGARGAPTSPTTTITRASTRSPRSRRPTRRR